MATLLGFAIILGGCTSTPERYEDLEQARALVQRVERNPLAEQAAGTELNDAKRALEQADTAAANRGDALDIGHFAYMARRNAEIAEERIAEARAREKISQSEAERDRVLLEARASEAERARALAERRGRQAEQNANEAERQRRRAEQALEETERLQESLQELKAKQTARGLVLTLGDVLFDTNKADLKPGATTTIDRLAEFLNDSPDRRILIEGYTDSRGADAYNQALSLRRANAVRDALRDRGIAADRISANGLGEAYPVASNDTDTGRQLNRRVEIVISDRDGEFAAAARR